jgi:hypothetical protein
MDDRHWGVFDAGRKHAYDHIAYWMTGNKDADPLPTVLKADVDDFRRRAEVRGIHMALETVREWIEKGQYYSVQAALRELADQHGRPGR